MKKSVLLHLRWSSIIHLHRLLLITTDGGDGRLFLDFPFTSGNHIIIVIIGLIITGIVLTPIVVVGIIDKNRTGISMITRPPLENFHPFRVQYLGSWVGCWPNLYLTVRFSADLELNAVLTIQSSFGIRTSIV